METLEQPFRFDKQHYDDVDEALTLNFLRSKCSGPNNCAHGKGLEFHSRISPSPSRSRSSRRSSTHSARNMEHPLARVRRTLDFDGADDNKQQPKTPLSSCRKIREKKRDRQHHEVSPTTALKPKQTRSSYKTPEKTKDAGADPFLEAIQRSPRLKAFQGMSWITSPRTGYTYVNSPTYRDTWTPDREVPMPHMARMPIRSYPKKTSEHPVSGLDFSDDESDFKESSNSEEHLDQGFMCGLLFSLMWWLRFVVYNLSSQLITLDTFILKRRWSCASVKTKVSHFSHALIKFFSMTFQRISKTVKVYCKSVKSGIETKMRTAFRPVSDTEIHETVYVKVQRFIVILNDYLIPTGDKSRKDMNLNDVPEGTERRGPGNFWPTSLTFCFQRIATGIRQLPMKLPGCSWFLSLARSRTATEVISEKMSMVYAPRTNEQDSSLTNGNNPNGSGEDMDQGLGMSWTDRILNFFPIFATREASGRRRRPRKESQRLCCNNVCLILAFFLLPLALLYIFYHVSDSDDIMAIPGKLVSALTTPLNTISVCLSDKFEVLANLARTCVNTSLNYLSMPSIVSESALHLVDWAKLILLTPINLFWLLFNTLTRLCTSATSSVAWLFACAQDRVLDCLDVFYVTPNLPFAPQNITDGLILVKNATGSLVNVVSASVTETMITSINYLLWFPFSLLWTTSVVSEPPKDQPQVSVSGYNKDLMSILEDNKDTFARALKNVMELEVSKFETQLDLKMNQAKEDVVRKLEAQRQEFQHRLNLGELEQRLTEKLRLEFDDVFSRMKEELFSKQPDQVFEDGVKDIRNAEIIDDVTKSLDALNETLISLDARWHRLNDKLTGCCQYNLKSIMKEYVNNSTDFTVFFGQHFLKPEDVDILKSELRNQLFEDFSSDISTIVHTRIRAEMDSAKMNHDHEETMTLEEEIRRLVQDRLFIYDADKTGMFDYALESAGASVVNIRCTETYRSRSAAYSLFGIPFWFPFNSPRTAIQPGASPGECWAFRGTNGYLVIQLSQPVRPTKFSMEHISREMSPNGKVDSAPRDFQVLGLMDERDPDPVLLGSYTYDADSGEPLQYFPVTNTDASSAFTHVELVITSNHGNLNFTCLYRFRVHGVP